MTLRCVPINDLQQWFERESTYRRRGVMDEIPKRFVSFDEYIKLLFAGTPGEYIVMGL